MYKSTNRNPTLIVSEPMCITLFMFRYIILKVSIITTILCIIDIGINTLAKFSLFTNLLTKYITNINNVNYSKSLQNSLTNNPVSLLVLFLNS